MKLFLVVAIVALTLFTRCSTTTTNNSATQAPTSDNTSTSNDNNVSSSEEKTTAPKKKKLSKHEKYVRHAKKIKLKVYNKKNLPIDYDAGRFTEFIELDYKIVNKSQKSIKGIKGILSVYDQFDELIMDLNWDVSEKVGAGKTKKITRHGLDYNQFIDEHRKLHELKFKDLTFKFEAEQINFTDGYKLKY